MSQDHLSVFNEKEQEVIQKCVESGQYTSIPSALESAGMLEFTPEKERAIEAFLSGIRPVDLGESAVQIEMDKWLLEGNVIDTPEKEKFWQEKMDAERAAKRAAMTGEQMTEEMKKEEEKVIPEDDMSEVELTKAEIMDALTAKQVKFKPQQSKAELSTLLDASNV